ncbi:MAG: hypothetical protein RXO26_02765 [Caldivirga sp.]
MKLEIEAYITGCSVFLLIKPESEEAEFGKVTSSVLRWAVSVFMVVCGVYFSLMVNPWLDL